MGTESEFYLHFKFPSEDNWDSYHGKPTTAEAIGRASSLQFSPVNSGGIQISLSDSDGNIAEIDIDPKGRIIGMFWSR